MCLKKIVVFIGPILLLEGIFMLPAAFISLFCHETKSFLAFLFTLLPLVIVGYYIFNSRNTEITIFQKDGMIITALVWVIISLFGALPLFISGTTSSFIDAFFEIVSGFTTTGASIIEDIDKVDKGILYWRSFTNWLGGMGVLVFFLALPAILKRDEASSMILMEAESPGPQVGKLVPKLRKTARILYIIYITLTVLQFIVYLLLNMNPFDALVNSFAAAGTGGFSIRDMVSGYYTKSQETAIALFMILFGVNFNVYYAILLGNYKSIFKNEELRAYVSLIIISTILITINTGELHNAFFTVSSIITSTGFAINNYDLWPSFSKIIILFLMIIGGCAGSTAGGIKISRLLLIFKQARLGIKKQSSPRLVSPIHMDDERVGSNMINMVNSFIWCYFLLLFISTLLVSHSGNDIITSLSASMACLGNTGPGLGKVGPASNFAFLPAPTKLLLCIDMLLGRLEIFPLLFLLSPKIRKGA